MRHARESCRTACTCVLCSHRSNLENNTNVCPPWPSTNEVISIKPTTKISVYKLSEVGYTNNKNGIGHETQQRPYSVSAPTNNIGGGAKTNIDFRPIQKQIQRQEMRYGIQQKIESAWKNSDPTEEGSQTPQPTSVGNEQPKKENIQNKISIFNLHMKLLVLLDT